MTAIPTTIHRIWVGPPIPSHLAAYGATWEQHHPGWEHRLWTEANMPRLANQDIYDRASEIAPGHEGQLRADVARYEILLTHGGLYVDCDMECVRPIDPLLESVTCFAGWEQPGVWVNNAILGATPGHPFLTELVKMLPANVAKHAGQRPNVLSGPQFLTRIYRRHKHRVTVYPKDYFYPYLWNELDRAGEDFPASYAIHRWHNRMKRLGAQSS